MISIIITSFKEPKTIGKAIEAFQNQKIKEKYELIVVAPDKETLNAAKKYSSVKTFQDEGKGKPAALNKILKIAKGDILIFTDGDVYVGENSVNELIKPFENKKIGAASGHPISLDSKKTMLGYWAYLLTRVANDRRISAIKNNSQFFCSGYLFAIKKELFPYLPEELLSEDGYISNNVYKNKYKIGYAKNAKVFIKYPTNFKDWIIQKKRSAGGYNQIKKITGVEMRSFKKESLGIFSFFKHIKSIQGFFYFKMLILARIYLWFVIYRDINFRKKTGQEIWQRVESTK